MTKPTSRRATRGSRTPFLPPKAFRKNSDGCSGVPDYHYRSCCIAHDYAYRHWKWWRMFESEWSARQWADRKLAACMMRANKRTAWIPWLVWWSWRPVLWYVVLRLVGWRAWRSRAERE